MEKFENKGLDENMTQRKISREMKTILLDYNKERNFEKETGKREKIEAFDNELRKKGHMPLHYELWYVLRDMNLPNKPLKFDTLDHDIENFIRQTFGEPTDQI